MNILDILLFIIDRLYVIGFNHVCTFLDFKNMDLKYLNHYSFLMFDSDHTQFALKVVRVGK